MWFVHGTLSDSNYIHLTETGSSIANILVNHRLASKRNVQCIEIEKPPREWTSRFVPAQYLDEHLPKPDGCSSHRPSINTLLR
jgi:hypothetical protein